MTTLVAAGLVLVQPGCNLIETRPNAAGASGGNSTTPTSSGGTTSSSGGSTTSSGGTTSTSLGGSGGSAGAGGTATISGGTTGSGGAASATGGATAPGGSVGSGGATARGGSTGSAGTTSAAGGSVASGGTTSVTTTTSNCTDDPPPGQTPTCAEWVSYNMCSQSWFATYCNKSCGRCSGTVSSGGITSGGGTTARGGTTGSGGIVTSTGGVVASSGGTSARGGTTGGGGVAGPGTTNPQITGTSGWASRYWDCCKPSCGWTGNSNPPVPSCQKDGLTRISVDSKNGCEGGGTAFECYDFSPWYDSGTNMSYGFAAYNGVPCGTCFELQFTGGGNSGPNAGATAIKGQQMIVQVINIGGIAANQFDLLIPGGGVGAMTAGCTAQWGNVDLGVTYGGLLSECGGDCTCMKGKCQSVFGSMNSAIKNGCDWFTGWYSCADNPQLVYKQVSCPSQITSKTGLSK